MTRTEIVAGLSLMLDHEPNHTWPAEESVVDALSAAIAYMQPVGDAEIEAARAWVEMRSPGEPITATLEHALDALSRLPALESMVADEVRQNETFEARCAACGGNYEDERNKHLKRIAALESEQRDYEKTCVRLNAQVNAIEASRRRAVDDAAEMAARVDRANARLALVLEAHADQATRGGQCGCVVSRVVNALVTDAGPAGQEPK